MAKSLPSPAESESASDNKIRDSYLCYFLAALIMTGIAWFIVDGVESTEPGSSARDAKVLSCIALLIVEGCLFSLAGRHPKHAFTLRLSACLIFILQIVLMSIVQISIGMTAAKTSEVSSAKIKNITEGAKSVREAAEGVQADAAWLRNSKHSWKRNEASQKSDKALAAVTAASGVSAELDQVNVSTPTAEVVGKNGLIMVSIFLSFVMEVVAVTLMHFAGVFRREALEYKSKVSVEYQILSVVEEIRGSAPHLQALQAPQNAPQLAPSPAPAAKAKGPTYSSWTTGVPLATMGVGALGALGAGAAQAVQAAPAVPQQPAQAAVPVNVNPPPPVNVDPPSAPSAPAEKARKARVGQGGAVMDTGVGPHDGYRYRRALEGVKAGTIRPSKDGLHTGVGASPPTAKRYLETMAAAGEIVPNPKGAGWVLASKGGAK
jgi:hypothetical protein